MNRDAVHDLIERPFAALVAELEAGRSDTLKTYLAAAARFHRYSWANQFLIATQCPDATRVAGFHTWRQLRRWVRRGEKGIVIIAPIVWRARTLDSDALEGEPLTAPLGFRAAYVFDILQTDGEPIPSIEQAPSGNPGPYLLALEQTVRDAGVALVDADDLGGAQGLSRPGRIDILSTLGPSDRFATLAHEFAHDLLHRRGERPASKTVRETEAEAVAFIVSTAVGVAASVTSHDYIALYDGSADTLRASLARIQGAARTIIDALHAVRSEHTDIPVA
jgi:hypothetical protein